MVDHDESEGILSEASDSDSDNDSNETCNNGSGKDEEKVHF